MGFFEVRQGQYDIYGWVKDKSIETVGRYNTYDEAKSNALALASDYAQIPNGLHAVSFAYIGDDGHAEGLGNTLPNPATWDIEKNLYRRDVYVEDFDIHPSKHASTPNNPIEHLSIDRDSGDIKRYVGGAKEWVPYEYKSPFDY